MDIQKLISDLIRDIAVSPHTLQRRPEPEAITEGQSANDYDRVMSTTMTVNYAACMDLVHRVRGAFDAKSKRTALDLCSGPGHYTLCLASQLGYKSVTGIDLSADMIAVAGKNARARGLAPGVSFEKRNVLDLVGAREFSGVDLVSFTNAAHHLPKLDDVRAVLTAADRIARADGVIVLSDMCRLNDVAITERFVRLAGDDYLVQGMNAMYDDFLASMLAAWSADEMAMAVPRDSERVWFQVVAAHMPYFQSLVGLPKGRTELFVRGSIDWSNNGFFRVDSARNAWAATKDLYYSGMIREVSAVKPASQTRGTGRKKAA